MWFFYIETNVSIYNDVPEPEVQFSGCSIEETGNETEPRNCFRIKMDSTAPHNRGLLLNSGVTATAHDAPGSLFSTPYSFIMDEQVCK